MFSSTIIPTIGRPTLARAVESVLQQDFKAADFEIILVNDTGERLPQAAWQESARVKMITTDRQRHIVASNAGAALAAGQYLHILHDDDWLLPGALQQLWELALEHPEAGWLYGGTRLVDRQGKHEIDLHHKLSGNIFVQAMSGEWIPMGSSLISAAAFFEVGGFDTSLKVGEDNDLTRRIAQEYDFAETRALISAYTIEIAGSSLPRELDRVAGRQSRDKILKQAGSFWRLRASASSPHWQGRIVRAYLGSVLLNLRQARLYHTLRSLLLGLISLLLAGRQILYKEFWRAIFSKYESFTFARGFQNKLRQAQQSSDLDLATGMGSNG